MKKQTSKFLLMGAIMSVLILAGCSDDDAPEEENPEEVIDLVTLTFTAAGADPIVVTATDPDAEGPEDLAPDGAINLAAQTEYSLTIKLENTEEGENITDEVRDEGHEHMFFFSFTTDIFSDPAGNGNVDARADDINYGDEDRDLRPIGITTTWTTSANGSSDGDFRVILKHQPEGLKTDTSTSSDGESDIDVTWTININN